MSAKLEQIGTGRKDLSRRERENLRQREEILGAAIKLFSEKGYHNVAMHEIAKEAEFGIGTLYKYFDNKEDLYRGLMMEVALAHHQALNEVFEHELNPLESVTRYVAVRKKLFFENLPIVRLYFAETRGASFNMKAGLDQEILKLIDQGIKKLANVFDQGIKENVFRARDPHKMALALDGMVNAFFLEFLRHPDGMNEEDILSSAMDIFLEGVLRK